MKKILFCMVLSLLLSGSIFAQLDVDEPLAEVNIDSEIYEIEWNATGSALAVASDDGFYLFNDDLELLAHGYAATTIYSVSWNPDGDVLAITHEENIEIWQWDGAALTLVETLTGDQTQLVVAWSPDGSLLASASGEESGFAWILTVQLWDTESWQVNVSSPDLFVRLMDSPFSNQMLWSPTGSMELVMLGDTAYETNNQYFYETVRQINFIDPYSGTINRFIPYISDFSASAAAWRPQGDVIAVGSDIDFGLYDVATGDHYPSSWMNEDFGNIILVYEPLAIDWTSDGRYVVTNQFVYDFVDDQYIGGFATHEGADIRAVDWHPDNVRLANADSEGHIAIQNAALFEGFVMPSISP